MRQSNRLILNSLAQFLRMPITVGVSLVATPVLLRELGHVDYGVFAVIGATSALLVILSDVLLASALRHLAYEVERSDVSRRAVLFNSTLAVFTCFAILVMASGLLLAPLVVNVLRIPIDRLDAAWWVFVLTVINVAMAMQFAPFAALVTAYQHLLFSTAVDVLRQLLLLAAVIVLLTVEGDQLIWWSMLWLCIYSIPRIVFGAYAIVRFPEARLLPFRTSWADIRKVGEFAGWVLLVQAIEQVYQRYVDIMINLGFGPIANAANAVAIRTGEYGHNLASSVLAVLRPAITTAAGGGKHSLLPMYVVVGCKYPTIVCMCYAVPVLLETPALLSIWLGDVPPQSVVFVRLLLIAKISMALSAGHHLLAVAQGEMRRYARIILGPHILAVILVITAIYLLRTPAWVILGITAVLAASLSFLMARAVSPSVSLPMSSWMRRVIGRVALVGLVASVPAVYFRLAWEPGPWRIIFVTSSFLLSAFLSFLIAGMEGWERDHFRRVGRECMEAVRSLLLRKSR